MNDKMDDGYTIYDKLEQAHSQLYEMAGSFNHAKENFSKIIEKIRDTDDALDLNDILEALPAYIEKQWKETCDTIAELYSSCNYGKYYDYSLDDGNVNGFLREIERLDQQAIEEAKKFHCPNKIVETQTKGKGR